MLIERGLVEIDHAIERIGGAGEVVERLAFGVLLRKTVAALELPSAEVTVAPTMRSCGHFARNRATPSFIAATTWSTAALPFLLKSLMPSS